MTNRVQSSWRLVDEKDAATAVRAVRLSKLRISDAVAVVGDGTLALATTAVLRARGVSNIVLVSNDGACAREAGRAGASVLPPPTSAEALAQVHKRLGGFGPDFVFGCEGKSDSCRLAIEIVRPGGLVVLMAQDAGATSMNPNLLVFPDKRVQGSGAPRDEDVQIARSLIKSDRLGIDSSSPNRTEIGS